jgi:hypothetical protein
MGNAQSNPSGNLLLSNICPNNNQIGTFRESDLTALYPNGLATDTIPYNTDTKTFTQSALQSYLNQLRSTGVIKNPPSDPRTGMIDLEAKAAQDRQLQNNIQLEYCFYEARYMYAMKRFIYLATALDKSLVPEAKRMGEYAKSLNLKINSLIELTYLISETRGDSVNLLKGRISETNNEIQNASNKIKAQYELLSKDNATIETQKEMVRYGKEKNDAILNQIAIFTILNAFVIGSIYAVVRA